MKSVLIIVAMLAMGACAHQEESQTPENEIPLYSASPDERMELDDQFLKKSQQSFQAEVAKKSTQRSVY